MSVFCGIDWAEQHHDVALVDATGQLIAKARIPDDAAGYRQLLDLLAEHGDTEAEPMPVAIETSRGLLVAVLRTGARQVYAINPLAASRYRDRHGVSRKKSDPGDALVLANILRTDMHAPPAAAGRQRTRPGCRCARPCSARRRLAPPTGRQPAALAFTRVLPHRTQRVRHRPQRRPRSS
jgi:hypothetical protein